MRAKSVSNNWFRQKDSNLSIKLSVTLLDGYDNDAYYSIYQTNQYDYLSININAYVVFQYKPVTGQYDRSYSVRVMEEDLYQMNKSLQEFYRKLARKDLFTYYTSGSVTCEPRRDDTQTISLKSGGFLEMEPGVVIDKSSNDNPLPGVYLYINQKSNKTELTIDEYEYLMYKFSKLDINSEGTKLIIMKLLLDQKDNKTATVIGTGEQVTERPNNASKAKTTSIFGASKPKVESVDDKRDLPNPNSNIQSLDDLM